MLCCVLLTLFAFGASRWVTSTTIDDSILAAPAMMATLVVSRLIIVVDALSVLALYCVPIRIPDGCLKIGFRLLHYFQIDYRIKGSRANGEVCCSSVSHL